MTTDKYEYFFEAKVRRVLKTVLQEDPFAFGDTIAEFTVRGEPIGDGGTSALLLLCEAFGAWSSATLAEWNVRDEEEGGVGDDD